MRIAMGLTALGCVFVGVNHEALYNMLPFAAEYKPYTTAHVVNQLQLQFFGSLAFILLLVKGLMPKLSAARNLDTDDLYCGTFRILAKIADKLFNGINSASDAIFVKGITGSINRFAQKAPQTLAVVVLAPFSSFFDKEVTRGEHPTTRIKMAFESGTVPTGVGAFCAVIFIFVMFLVKG